MFSVIKVNQVHLHATQITFTHIPGISFLHLLWSDSSHKFFEKHEWSWEHSTCVLKSCCSDEVILRLSFTGRAWSIALHLLTVTPLWGVRCLICLCFRLQSRQTQKYWWGALSLLVSRNINSHYFRKLQEALGNNETGISGLCHVAQLQKPGRANQPPQERQSQSPRPWRLAQ